MGSNWRSCEIDSCGVTSLAEVFMASDCLWLSGVVDYTESIGHGVCNKGLRPEL